jgi:hypothetical protein
VARQQIINLSGDLGGYSVTVDLDGERVRRFEIAAVSSPAEMTADELDTLVDALDALIVSHTLPGGAGRLALESLALSDFVLLTDTVKLWVERHTIATTPSRNERRYRRQRERFEALVRV